MQLAQSLLKEELEQLEQHFQDHLATQVPLIREAGGYILASGGKRIRPLLLLLCTRLSGYRGEHRHTLAVIVEFLHTATLLHDDVVDGAVMRRGQAAVNAAWGNEAAVLVGDFLFARCFEMMLEVGDHRILKTLAGTASLMAEGEVLQLVNSGDLSLDEPRYLAVVRNKTAALFSATCRCGAILGQLPREREDCLAAFGMALGMAFQLIDDILDYVADQAESGKLLGRDLAEGKLTLPLIHVLRRCGAGERQRLSGILAGDDLADDDLNWVRALIDRYDGIALTRQQADRFLRQAHEHLTVFPASPVRQALCELADYAVNRRR
jgi:octaprenyl-diphosphate synthase